jgi:hypothetical protein
MVLKLLYAIFIISSYSLLAKDCKSIIALLSESKERKARNLIETRAIQFFLENTDPKTGMTLDRAPAFEKSPPSNTMASLGGTGFEMTVLAHAAQIGKLPTKTAEKYIENGLKFAASLQNYKGWLPHFVHWQTGKIVPHSEISTIDTALFMAGALYAAKAFPNNKIINDLAQKLYRRLDFRDMMTNGGTKPEKRTVSMGWDPETKEYIKYEWDTYSEHMILQILGLGHPDPKKRLPIEAWHAWKRQVIELPDGKKLMGADLPLFAHQYPWMWLDPKKFEIDGIVPFENSKIATLRDRELSKKDPRLSAFNLWGLSASDSAQPEGYRAFRHGDGKGDPGDNVGTVCPGCAAASMVFAPEAVLPYISELMKGPYKNKIVGRYGFADAFNPSKNWSGPDSLAITIAPAYMSSVNLEDGSIWKTFNSIDSIIRGTEATGEKNQ